MRRESANLIVGFSYDHLDTEVAARLRKDARTIKETIGKIYLETGGVLIAAKKILGHGQFQAWILAEFSMNIRTAQRLMNAAQLASKHDIVSHLKPTVLYALASPSTPPSVQDTVIRRLRRGDHPTQADIKQLVKAAQPANKRRNNQITVKSEPTKGGLIHMSPAVGVKVMGGLPPADQKIFWGRIHRGKDYLIVDRIAKSYPRR